MSGVPQRARPASAGAALDRKSRARHDGSPADDSNEERGAVRGRVALLPRSSEAQPWFRRSVTHTHHRTKRWASHSTWAGPPVPRRRARAGAPLLGFWGIDVGVTAQHNQTHLAVVGRFCVRAVRRVACVPVLCRGILFVHPTVPFALNPRGGPGGSSRPRALAPCSKLTWASAHTRKATLHSLTPDFPLTP